MKEEKKFILETIRTTCFGFAAFYGSLFVADKIRNEAAYEAFLQRERMVLKKEVIDSLLVMNYEYSTGYMRTLNRQWKRFNYEPLLLAAFPLTLRFKLTHYVRA